MKLRQLSTVAALLSLSAVAACATSAKTQISDPLANPDGTIPGDGTIPAEEESDDPADQPPHSLGTIVLGEAHSSVASGTSTKSTPIVSANFIPDALLTRTCKKKLDSSCEIQQVAKCTKVSTSTTGCNSNEACVLDNTTCKATCKTFATTSTCTKTCDDDELCKPSSDPDDLQGGTCVKREYFDAGPLAFSGTTQSITMFPPYAFETTGGQGAPFLGGAELRVQASGATDAGFEKFDEKFTATTFLQTSPSLAKIPREKIFGSGSIPIAWAPAADTILITITGAGGSATCKVKDSLGKFDVPRSVVEAAQGESTSTSTTASLSITVARQKKEVKKDKKAKGELSITKVKPAGWLELITTSTESASFQGCASTQSICDNTCTDVKYDRENCGSCGNSCSTSETCSNGSCVGSGSSGTTGTTCSTCRSNAAVGGCSSYRSTCSANFDCDDVAYCAQSCTSASCVANCEASYPAGKTAYASLKSCLTSYCSSTCGF